MSRRVSLKEFQEGLSKRLKAAAGETAPTARLGFEAGGEHWLARLDHSGEVFQVPDVQRVPLTKDWFLGVANIRGALFGVTDFGAFLGKPLTARGPDNRLLLIGQPFGVNCALHVSRLAGLRNVADFEAEPPSGPFAVWSASAWRDKEGRVWRELDTERLLAHREFIDIAVH
ncbi:MAG: chemotaxis protein CheW [Burkholderiales bacterium]